MNEYNDVEIFNLLQPLPDSVRCKIDQHSTVNTQSDAVFFDNTVVYYHENRARTGPSHIVLCVQKHTRVCVD